MIFIILSALIYLGAFIYPIYLWPGIFIWMSILIVHDTNNRYGWKEGLVWGLIFFAGHLAWLLKLIACKGQGDCKFLIYPCAVLYFSLYCAFWLGLKQQLFRIMTKRIDQKGKCAALCWTWVISTATFIYLTCYCSLAIFGCFEGYPFINPLLPLVSCSRYLKSLPFFGCVGYIIIIVIFNAVTAELYRKADITRLMVMMAFLAFPTILYDHAQKKYVKKIDFFYLQPSWKDLNLTESQTFYEIGRQLNKIVTTHQDVRYIVMPESSFGYNLLAWQDKLAAWTDLFEGTTIFIGGHGVVDDKIFNSLYAIHNGTIVGRYDKQHLVPFVERVPRWIRFFSSVFMMDGKEFSYPAPQDNDNLQGFRPYICSELFFCGKLTKGTDPILCVCNDSWLMYDYAKELALRCAQIYSMQHRLEIVYVGHCFAKFINY